ncbi:Sporangia induced predicted protein, partial [Globisporangium splendens]
MQTGSAKDSPSEVILGSRRVHIAAPKPPAEHLTRMPRTKCAADKKRETLEDIWRAFNDWIQSRFDMGKTYGLQQRKSLTPPVLASLEEINFTKIAIKFSRSLTKDLVFSGVRDLLQRIGEVAGTGAALSIAFNFGRLIAKNRPPSLLGNLADLEIPLEDVVDYVNFNPEDHRRSDKERAQVATVTFMNEPFLEAFPTSRSNPENVISCLDTTSLEDELQMHDLLLSPGRDRENPVMESAFKRHVSTLAEEVDLEAKYAHDVQLQQRRDVETIALENKMRRMCAEDMQRHLQQQMEHRRKARSSERNEQKMIDSSASSFYCDGEQTRLGYDDKEYLQKNKMDLKEQLLGQISSKAQERVSNREKNLLDDKDRDELRKTVTESWRRDATMKKLVETKKKQRAAEQIHRDVVAPGKGGAYYGGYCPHLPQPSTPRFNMMVADTDFSVGFDIRSVCD